MILESILNQKKFNILCYKRLKAESELWKIKKFSALLCAVACFFAGSSDAQYLASPYVASYAPAYAAYSPYAYGGVYTGYAAGYPAYYGWGSNKGAAPASAPNTGKLTNNQ